ncbi:hypothetical protein [Patulibacter minatonensis]|uniref:hypothetical protein n=1 Tax=Patulibacter minatonensis TaxID=298163 RepID=UPI00047D4EDA|nr:hypothetical protein [Patulibacter minatonensis]
MSTQDPNAAGQPGGEAQPSQEEMMAAYEEQMRNIRVEEVLVQSLASFIELGGRRGGLAGDPEQAGEPDLDQLGLAIEVIRALQPLAAPLLGPSASQVDQALSQLQVAFAQQAGTPAPGQPGGPSSTGGQPGPGGAAGPGGQQPEGPGGGRLWVPGQ